MEDVTIQIKNHKNWEDNSKQKMTFKTWEDVTIFAYQLSLLYNIEIRVESNGNGHYYHPEKASDFLNQIKSGFAEYLKNHKNRILTF